MTPQQHFSAEQRRALKILAAAGREGVNDAALRAHGFLPEMLAGFVLDGLAAAVTETIGPAIKVERHHITAAGRKAIAG
jgi:hypothetical protein